MYNKLKKLIAKLLPNKTGGWMPDEPDARDFKYAEHFKEEIFGAVLPEKFIRTMEELPRLPRQYRILSCVSCAFTFVNNFNSKHYSKNDVFLSWRMIYSLVYHYATGTTFKDNSNALRGYGQCTNAFLPEELSYLGEYAVRDRKKISKEAYEVAENYKIGGYFYINKNQAEMKAAIQNSPIIVGVYTNNNIWKEGKVIQWNGWSQYGHGVSIAGWDDSIRAWQVCDWDGGGFKWLSYDYPLMSTVTLRDLPDNYLDNHMKIVKTFSDPRIFAITPKGTKFHIISMTQFEAGQRQGFWDMGQLKVIEPRELDTYKDEKNPPTFIV